jgi:hypothetical protein
MATPGNFGGGSTGPDQIFLGITRAPPSAPGRGRAQSPVRRSPNPQATGHRARGSTRAARSRGFLPAIHNTGPTKGPFSPILFWQVRRPGGAIFFLALEKPQTDVRFFFIGAGEFFFGSIQPELAITRCVYLNPTPPPGPRKRGGRRRVSPCTAVQDEIDNSVPVQPPKTQ